MNNKGAITEESWLITTFLIILITFAVMICGIYSENMELCKIALLVLLAAVLSIPLRRRVFLALRRIKITGK